MKNLFLSLFIALTLVIAPVAHAMDLDCAESVSKTAEMQVKKDFSNSSKQTQKSGAQTHNCECSHTASDRVAAKTETLRVAVTKAPLPAHDAEMTSMSYGPPLEPPAHA